MYFSNRKTKAHVLSPLFFEESDRYSDVRFCFGKRHIDRQTLSPVVMDQAVLHLMRAGARVRACVCASGSIVEVHGRRWRDGLPMGHSSCCRSCWA